MTNIKQCLFCEHYDRTRSSFYGFTHRCTKTHRFIDPNSKCEDFEPLFLAEEYINEIIANIRQKTIDGVLSRHKTEVRKILNEETLKTFKKQAQDVDTIMLFTLHEVYGFGKERLTKFAKQLVDIHQYCDNRYEDWDIFKMKMELKKIGLNMDELGKQLLEGRT